jgi:hypothetical protein
VEQEARRVARRVATERAARWRKVFMGVSRH